MTSSAAAEALIAGAHEITGRDDDYDQLIDLARDRRVVLIGEASHGTHEFYDERARITRRLIDECGFTVVIHLDRTRALEPLDCSDAWDRGEPPETFPTGI